MSDPKLLAKQANPSFFAFHPKMNVLYVVTETNRNDPKSPASVVSYRYSNGNETRGQSSTASSPTATLTQINSQPVDGDIPCHVSIDATGEFMVIANYSSGSVVVFRIAADGSIQSATDNVQHPTEPGPVKPKSPRGHCSVWDPTNRYVLVADLGLDKVLVYEFNRSQGKLVPSKFPYLEMAAGAGPRHISIHPNGKWIYIINELNLTMTAALWDAQQGRLTEINTVSTVPAGTDTKGFSTAEVIVHPNGKFVYGSNRGHNTIASFRIDGQTGRISSLSHTPSGGKTPRNFRISPDGNVLLSENQQSDSILSFSLNQDTGELKPTGNSISVKAPACIKFVP